MVAFTVSRSAWTILASQRTSIPRYGGASSARQILTFGSRSTCRTFTSSRTATTVKPPSVHSCQTGDMRMVPFLNRVANVAQRGSARKSPTSSGRRFLRIRPPECRSIDRWYRFEISSGFDAAGGPSPQPLPPFDRLREQGEGVCFGNDRLEYSCTFVPSYDHAEGRRILRPSARRVAQRRLRIVKSVIPLSF